MAQNNKRSLALSNPIEILNKAQSIDGKYGVYDTEQDALIAMAAYGLDGRLVAVYTDKPNGRTKVFVYNAQKQRLDPIYEVEDLENRIIQIGEVSLVEDGGVQKVIVPDSPMPIWKIGGAEYKSDAGASITIPFAANGKYRIDYVVATTDNGFQRVEGVERLDFGVPPQMPDNTVLVIEVNIFGETVLPDPVPTTGWITQSSKKWVNIGVVNSDPIYIPYSSERTSFSITAHNEPDYIPIISGFKPIDGDNNESIYDGLDIYIKNSVFTSVLLKNNTGEAVPFYFHNGQDVVLALREIAHFKYSARENRMELVSRSQGIIEQPPQNPDYEILSLVNFHTEGTFDEGNQYVVGDATALYPLVWKYQGTTYTIDQEIRLPTSIDYENWRRKDPILLKPNGTVALQEGIAVEANSPQQAVLPTIDEDDYFLGYVDWLPSGANIEAPKTKLSEFENDMNFQTGDEVGMKIAESFNIRIKQDLTAPSATEVISTAGLEAELNIKSKTLTGNYVLKPADKETIIYQEGKTITFNPNTQSYGNDYLVFVHNHMSTRASLVLTPHGSGVDAWKYVINKEIESAGLTVTIEKGGSYMLLRKAGTNTVIFTGDTI